MSILGPYVHRIDPIIGTIFGVHLWWYGLSYTLGFLNAHLFVKRIGFLTIVITYRSRRARAGASVVSAVRHEDGRVSAGIGWRPIPFALLLAFSLILPSDWTQDVPSRYGKRHAGLAHSAMYPEIDTAAK